MTKEEFIRHVEKLCPDLHPSIKIIGPKLDNVLIQFTFGIQELFSENIIKQLKFPDLFIKNYVQDMLFKLRDELNIHIRKLAE